LVRIEFASSIESWVEKRGLAVHRTKRENRGEQPPHVSEDGPMATIVHQMTQIYSFTDDALKAHPEWS
jgi:hypothetical protein